jgi:hypothetical protein
MLFGESQESEERREEETMDVRKIIYCSRTHSQLSQFMREVKPVILASIRILLMSIDNSDVK